MVPLKLKVTPGAGVVSQYMIQSPPLKVKATPGVIVPPTVKTILLGCPSELAEASAAAKLLVPDAFRFETV